MSRTREPLGEIAIPYPWAQLYNLIHDITKDFEDMQQWGDDKLWGKEDEAKDLKEQTQLLRVELRAPVRAVLMSYESMIAQVKQYRVCKGLLKQRFDFMQKRLGELGGPMQLGEEGDREEGNGGARVEDFGVVEGVDDGRETDPRKSKAEGADIWNDLDE